MIALVKILKYFSIKKTQFILGFFVMFIGCDLSRELISFSGETMGTTYNIKVISASKIFDVKTIKLEVDSLLNELNKQMSTWDTESEISKFNISSSNKIFHISTSFMTVLRNAYDISVKTNGLFDVTVYDLMKSWGFGPNPLTEIPSQSEIDSILVYTGFNNIILLDNGIIKSHPKTKLDLNAIAKGYAVDIVFYHIQSKGFTDIFIEIGGELRCSGYNQNNEKWLIGIEKPMELISSDNNITGVIKLDNKSVATSGNYRNFINLKGENLGHTINPLTGYPIKTDILSVTTIANSCMEADAWATALMAMDYETGLEILSANNNIKAIWIIKSKDDELQIRMSNNIDLKNSIYPIIK